MKKEFDFELKMTIDYFLTKYLSNEKNWEKIRIEIDHKNRHWFTRTTFLSKEGIEIEFEKTDKQIKINRIPENIKIYSWSKKIALNEKEISIFSQSFIDKNYPYEETGKIYDFLVSEGE